jgi:hypothetical protein
LVQRIIEVNDWTTDELTQLREKLATFDDVKAGTILYCFKLGAFELRSVFSLVKLGTAPERENKSRVWRCASVRTCETSPLLH